MLCPWIPFPFSAVWAERGGESARERGETKITKKTMDKSDFRLPLANSLSNPEILVYFT